VLAKTGNTLQLWRSRRWLVPAWSAFRGRLARWLLTDSLAYLVLTVVAGMVEMYVVQNLYGRLAGPVGVTAYAVLTTLTTATLGFVLMVTTPAWPAIVDARSKGDLGWIRQTSWRLRVYAVAVAVCAGGGLLAVGPWLLPLWVGPKAAALDRTVLAGYALYLLVYAWRHTHHMLLIGLGRVRLLAGVQLVESSLVLGAAWFGMHHGGLAPLLLAMAATIALVTGWSLPWILHRDLRLGVDPARL
jgi:O-antigen/teichoic acid export membrane protein